MRARVGDRIILAAEHIDQPTRDGEVLEVRGEDGGPPYLVRWSDGHTGLIFPGPGTVLRLGTADEVGAPATAHPHADATSSAPVTYVREWSVRVSILESGDDTRASVVLLADAPGPLSARGASHRSSTDDPVATIGDEVAVARALRHLADRLVETAEHAIEARTGEEVHVRRT
ncbi:DUF1918 domain-containing protein [Humibacillus xanthopallidus]|uniref:Uncharacterized protein DUF1876 n=1 Tax=Humibacillus xanthopallidus TaxID=412689 RepID=A0A543HGP8_9MICO|nr:DUF1918 domain-containing protein [Humibacillus xanthopallidus]TQM57512.1 uncharacterized protein DUF1876 [Humibacillus xanthopallidus]